MPKIDDLFVEIGAEIGPLRRDLARASREVKGFGSTVEGLAKSLAGAFAVREVARFAAATFDLAASVGETASKFETVFGPAADGLAGSLDNLANKAGLTATEAKGVAATLGGVFTGLGFAEDAAAGLSEEAVRLAADLASFNNVPIEQTARAITGAITGEREALKTLGIVVTEADVQARALADTGKSVAGALTAQDKAAASLALTLDRAGKAVGDLDRTQDSAANRAKRLGAEFREVRETLAVAFLPVFETVIDRTGDLADGFDGLDLGGVADGVDKVVTAGADLFATLGRINTALGGTEGALGAVEGLFDDLAAEVERANKVLGFFASVFETFSAAKATLADLAGGARTGGAEFQLLNDELKTGAELLDRFSSSGRDFSNDPFLANRANRPPAPPVASGGGARSTSSGSGSAKKVTDEIGDSLKALTERLATARLSIARLVNSETLDVVEGLRLEIDETRRAMEGAAEVAGERGAAAFRQYGREVEELSKKLRSVSLADFATSEPLQLIAPENAAEIDALVKALFGFRLPAAEAADVVEDVTLAVREVRTAADEAARAYEMLGPVLQEAVGAAAAALAGLADAGAVLGGSLGLAVIRGDAEAAGQAVRAFARSAVLAFADVARAIAAAVVKLALFKALQLGLTAVGGGGFAAALGGALGFAGGGPAGRTVTAPAPVGGGRLGPLGIEYGLITGAVERGGALRVRRGTSDGRLA